MRLAQAPPGQEWVHLCDSCCYIEDESFMVGAIPGHGICARCGGLGLHVVYADAERPRLAYGAGFKVPTSCVTIEPLRSPVVWDVNRYYADLGVAPDATRAEIRQAFLAQDGHSSPRLAYVTKQLLNPERRRLYDSIPLGSFLFDAYLEAAIKDKIVAQAVGADPDDLEAIDLSALMDERLSSADFDKMVGQGVDKGAEEWKDRSHVVASDWLWEWYLWRSNGGEQLRRRLSEWQTAVVAALAARREVRRFTIGLIGHTEQVWVVHEVRDGRTVLFFNDAEPPSQAAAQDAVDWWLQGSAR